MEVRNAGGDREGEGRESEREVGREGRLFRDNITTRITTATTCRHCYKNSNSPYTKKVVTDDDDDKRTRQRYIFGKWIKRVKVIRMYLS